uniref:Uncharacterized protein n=1 Tax=Tanacetum cinerariifolium TaxID=118510 RepID=A0A6L2NJJ7_TANCI|nr:hypothetical protein [Tanacetum cinerariifolium]
MSSINADQAKLGLELVPKKKRLEIRKCNGRLNPEKIQREPTFQVILDALALTLRYSAFLITADVPEKKSNLWCILPESLTSPEMKETKAYKTYLVSTEVHMRNSKRVKRLAKKSTKAPASGVVIRETPKMPLSKKKEKVDVTQDFKHEINKSESGSKSDHEENKEDEDGEEEVKDEFVKNPSNDSGNEDEAKITDKAEEEGTDAVMTNVQERNENSKILQVIEDAHVSLSTVPQKTKVPVTSFSHLSDLVAKFLNFLDIPHTDAEIVSPMDVHVHHEVPSQQTPTLLIVHVLIIFDSSPPFSTIIPQSLPSFTPLPHQSTSTAPTTTKATNPPSTLPDFA